MKISGLNQIWGISLCALLASCGSPEENKKEATDSVVTAGPVIKTESVSYKSNGIDTKGFVAYNESAKGPRPVVVVVPEWWGLNDYTKSRAKQLADLGYFAIAADLFGNGKNAMNPKEAMEFTGTYYAHPTLSLNVIKDALAKAASFPEADTSRSAAIGYCFGGFIVLNAAKLGAPLRAVVSFHGGLGGVQPVKGQTHADILVCQGATDQFVPETERAAFKKSMDSVGAHYTFVEYPDAGHAFSNPNATETGKKFNLPIAYNASADSASWKAMVSFFQKDLQ